MISHICELPVGYRDESGTVHRRAVYRPLSGREEEILAVRDSTSSAAALVSEVLASCIEAIGDICPITVDHARGLSVSDRQYLLLKLRGVTFGEKVQAIVQCPMVRCNAKVDIDFHLSQLPVPKSNTPLEYKFQLSDEAYQQLSEHTKRDVRFRLPLGSDQEAIAVMVSSNEAKALSQLLSYCLITIGDIEQPTLEQTQSLPSLVRREIEQQLEEVTPETEMVMDVVCPECGCEFSAPFNIQDFFFGELKINDTVLRKEVHYLAYHYHWSETEIMTMPRQKRRQYIDTLAEEIEKLNDVAQQY